MRVKRILLLWFILASDDVVLPFTVVMKFYLAEKAAFVSFLSKKNVQEQGCADREA